MFLRYSFIFFFFDIMVWVENFTIPNKSNMRFRENVKTQPNSSTHKKPTWIIELDQIHYIHELNAIVVTKISSGRTVLPASCLFSTEERFGPFFQIGWVMIMAQRVFGLTFEALRACPRTSLWTNFSKGWCIKPKMNLVVEWAFEVKTLLWLPLDWLICLIHAEVRKKRKYVLIGASLQSYILQFIEVADFFICAWI